MPFGCLEFAPVIGGMNFNYNAPNNCLASPRGTAAMVVVHNQLSYPAVLQWDTGSGVTLQPGVNRIAIPNYNQRERARVNVTKCAPRCRLYTGPGNLLEMGRVYRLSENNQGQPWLTLFAHVDCLQ